jgi:hypothetical protein
MARGCGAQKLISGRNGVQIEFLTMQYGHCIQMASGGKSERMSNSVSTRARCQPITVSGLNKHTLFSKAACPPLRRSFTRTASAANSTFVCWAHEQTL